MAMCIEVSQRISWLNHGLRTTSSKKEENKKVAHKGENNLLLSLDFWNHSSYSNQWFWTGQMDTENAAMNISNWNLIS